MHSASKITLMLLLASTFLSHSMLVQADFTTNHTLAEKESYQWLVDLVPGFGDWNHYLNYSEMVGLLERLNYTYPSIAKVFSIGKSWQNREIYCIELTGNKSGGVKPQVLLVGLHHARESISAELPLYFAVLATSNYGTSSPMTSLLDCSDIFIIPALNVDGLDLVKVNEWQRKNACPLDDDGDGLVDENPPSDLNHDGHLELVINSNGNCSQWVEGIDSDGDGQISEDWVGGVDLNRNYGFEWDNPLAASSDTFPSSDVYRGPQPFSEPETRALRDLALNHDFKYAVSFHSGSECIIYPWGYTATPTLDDKLFREVAGNMSKLVGASAFQGGAGLYTVSGELGDWMYANRSTYAFTCEMFQNASAWHQDIIQEGLSSPKVESYGGVFESCNPNPREIVSTVKKWLPVIPYVTIRAVGYVPPTHLSPPLEPTVVHFVATAMTPDVYPGLMILLASVLVSVRFRSRKIEKQRKSDSPSPKYQDPISRLSLSDH